MLNRKTMRIVFFGLGKMGMALARGLRSQGHELAGFAPRESTRQAAADLGIDAYPADSWQAQQALLQRSDCIVLAVKPYGIAPLAKTLSSVIGSEATVVSVAAGISLATLREALGPAPQIARLMPNLGAMVQASASAFAVEAQAEAALRGKLIQLFEAAGSVCEVSEAQLDAVTALSGSGPAYFMLLAEAMVEAGVRLGLPRATARALAHQTALGTGQLLGQGTESAAELRWQVTSPGGTTAAAVAALESQGLRGAVDAALDAAWQKSRKLSGA